MSLTGASMARHRSEQSVSTPKDLIDAVVGRFGPISWDLAAEPTNAKAPRWLGPGGIHEDALKVAWHTLAHGENLWLNCPFGDIRPWVEKCAEESRSGARILLLVPASVDSNWYADFVHRKAMVHALSPRVRFDGHKTGFPKPLVLAVYDRGPAGFDVWRWKS